MAVTTEIIRSYRAPRDVLRQQLHAGVREDRALVYLYAACLIILVSRLPALARQAHLDPSVPLEARIGGALLAWLFIMPLVFYALAAVSHLVARMLGGQGNWYSARLALFWALLASSPLWLLLGLIDGLIAAGPARGIVGAVCAAAFVTFWAAGLRETETAPVGA